MKSKQSAASASVFSVSSHFKSATRQTKKETADSQKDPKRQKAKTFTDRLNAAEHSENKDLKDTFDTREAIQELEHESEADSPVVDQAKQ